MPPTYHRGEVWLVDLGMAAKTRRCLVLSIATDPQDRVLVTLVPHTTSLHGTRFEVIIPIVFLHPGAFDAQGLITVPYVKLIRCLGDLTQDEMLLIEEAVRFRLGL